MADFRHKRKKDGFTLIEVLVTIFLLGVSLISLLGLFVYGFNIVSRSRQVHIASQIVQEEVERIRNLDYETLISYGNGYSFQHDLLSELGQAEASVAIEDGAGEDIKKVTVSAAWKYKGRKLYRNLVTFVLRDGINKR